MNLKLKPIVASIALGLAASPAFAHEEAKLDLVAKGNSDYAVKLHNAEPDWFNRITISGKVNVDATYANRKTLDTASNSGNNEQQDKSSSNINVNTAAIFVDADINQYIQAHIGVNLYSRKTEKSNVNAADVVDGFGVNEAFVLVSDPERVPLYMKAGRFYQGFGNYTFSQDINTGFVEQMSRIRAEAAAIGFAHSSGLHGEFSIFQGDTKKVADANRNNLNNWVAGLGYAGEWEDVNFDFGVQYVNNIADAARFVAKAPGTIGNKQYTSRIGGVAVNASAKFNQFDGHVKYVTAAKRFDAADFQADGDATRGAKPSAWQLELGYQAGDFGVGETRFSARYERTSQASTATDGPVTRGLNLSKSRYHVQGDMDVFDYTTVSLQVAREHDYSIADGGTGKRATIGTIRLGVKFA